MKSWNISLSIIVVCSFASLIIVIVKYNPFAVGWHIKALFFISLTLFLLGSGGLILKNLVLRIKRNKQKEAINDFS